jgi:hypothetical protein
MIQALLAALILTLGPSFEDQFARITVGTTWQDVKALLPEAKIADQLKNLRDSNAGNVGAGAEAVDTAFKRLGCSGYTEQSLVEIWIADLGPDSDDKSVKAYVLVFDKPNGRVICKTTDVSEMAETRWE